MNANEKKEIKSVLKLKNLYFENISFNRDKTLPDELETKFETKYKDINDSEIEVKLICYVKSKSFELTLSLVGEFENTEQDKEIREEINHINTISIMFPYMRAELSLITAQPNFPTIDLPIVNINALLANDGKLCAKKYK